MSNYSDLQQVQITNPQPDITRLSFVYVPTMLEEIAAVCKAIRNPQFRLLQSFKDRGKYDVKFSWDRSTLTLSIDVPNSKIAAYGRHPSKIAFELYYIRNQTNEAFVKFVKTCSEKEEFGSLCRLLALDAIGFDFSIDFPQLDNRTIFFRHSSMEFCPNVPSASSSQKPTLNQIHWSCQMPDRQMYLMPKMSFLDETTWMQLQLVALVQTLKSMFPLYYILSDIHLRERCINRQNYSIEHMRLLMHFYKKTHNYSIMYNQTRKPNTKGWQYTIRVVFEDGDMEVILLIIRDTDVRFKIYDHNRMTGDYRQRQPQFYKEIYDNFVKRWPFMKEILILQEIFRDVNRRELRLAVRLLKIQSFEMVLLAIYQFIHFRMEIEMLRNKPTINNPDIKVLKSAVVVTRDPYEFVIQHCFETSEHVLQSIKWKNEEEVKFFNVLSRYISQQLNVTNHLITRQNNQISVSLPLLLEDCTKKSSSMSSNGNILVCFLELFRQLDELVKKLQPNQKQNLTKFLEKLVNFLVSQMNARPSKSCKWLKMDQVKDSTVDKPVYEFVFRWQDFNAQLLRDKTHVRVRTDLQDAWYYKSGQLPEKRKNKNVKKIEEIKSLGRDLKIDEFIL